MTIKTIADIFKQASTIYRAMQSRRHTLGGMFTRSEQPLMNEIDSYLAQVQPNDELPKDLRKKIYSLLSTERIEVTHKYGLLLSFLKGVLEIDYDILEPKTFAEQLKKNATTLGVLKPNQDKIEPSIFSPLWSAYETVSQDDEFNKECAQLFIEAIDFLTLRNVQLQENVAVAELKHIFHKTIDPKADSIIQRHYTQEAVADLSAALLHLSGSLEDASAQPSNPAIERSAANDAQRLVSLDKETKAIKAKIVAETQKESPQQSDGSRGTIMALQSKLQLLENEMEELLAELKASKTTTQVKEQLESEVKQLQTQLIVQEKALTEDAEAAKRDLELKISEAEALSRIYRNKAQQKSAEAEQLDRKMQQMQIQVAQLSAKQATLLAQRETEMMASIADKEEIEQKYQLAEERNDTLMEQLQQMQALLAQSQQLSDERLAQYNAFTHQKWITTEDNVDLVTKAAIEKLIALHESQKRIIFYFQQLEILAQRLDLKHDSPVSLEDTDWDHLEMAYTHLIVMYKKVSDTYKPLFDSQAYQDFSAVNERLHKANTTALEQLFAVFEPKLTWFIQSTKYAVKNETDMDQFINTAAAFSKEILMRFENARGCGSVKTLKQDSFYSFVINFSAFCLDNIDHIEDMANKNFNKTHGKLMQRAATSSNQSSPTMYHSLADNNETADESADESAPSENWTDDEEATVASDDEVSALAHT